MHTARSRGGSQARVLMGPPRHFAVGYSIDPWMDPQGMGGERGRCSGYSSPSTMRTSRTAPSPSARSASW